MHTAPGIGKFGTGRVLRGSKAPEVSSIAANHEVIPANLGRQAYEKKRQPFDNGTERDPGEVFLDPQVEAAAWSYYQSDSIVGACINQIKSYIAMSYPVVRMGGKIMKPSPEFRNVLDRYWKRAAMDMIDYMNVIGITPVALIQSEEGFVVPKVPAHETGRISTKTIDHVQYFRWWSPDRSASGSDWVPTGGLISNNFYDLGNLTDRGWDTTAYAQPFFMSCGANGLSRLLYDPSVIIFDNFLDPPSTTGQVNSPIKKLLVHHQEYRHMLRCLKLAEERNCTPTLFTERPEGNNTAATAGLGLLQGHYLDGGNQLGEIVDEKNAYQRNLQELKRHFEQTANYQALSRDGGMGEYSNDCPPPLAIFPLPTGRKLSAVASKVTAPDHIIERTRAYADQVCVALGVPYSTLTLEGSSRTTRGNLEGVNKAFLTRLKLYQTKLSEILTQLYQTLYQSHDAEWVIDRMLTAARRAGAHPDLMNRSEADRKRKRYEAAQNAAAFTEAELFKARECSHVTITLEIPGTIDYTTLEEMWKVGIIDNKEFAMHGRLAGNIPESSGGCGYEESSDLDKWKTDEKKALLLGKGALVGNQQQKAGTKPPKKKPKEGKTQKSEKGKKEGGNGGDKKKKSSTTSKKDSSSDKTDKKKKEKKKE